MELCSLLPVYAIITMAHSNTRWSLRALSQLERGSPKTATTLLETVADRLHEQHQACQKLSEYLASSTSASKSALTNIDHLTHVHHDTWMQCHRILDNGSLLERWSQADQNYIKSLFAQTRDRHAPAMERWVDVANDLQDIQAVEHFVEPILQRRIGIQLLADHYEKLHKSPNMFPHGAVQLSSPLWTSIQDAFTEAHNIGELHLLASPDIKKIGDDKSSNNPPAATVVHSWLHHALMEIFKNSIQAVVEYAQEQVGASSIDSSTLPPVEVEVTQTLDHYRIDIVDEGTGISSNNVASVFEWGRSSAEKRWDRLEEQQSYAAVRSPLRSLGVGLPLSQLFMRHFGGDLTLEDNDNKNGCRVKVLVPRNDDILEVEASKP